MKWLMMSDKNWCLNCPTECHFSPWRAEHCTKVTILCCLKPAKIQKTSQHPHLHANAICQGQTPHLLQHSRTAWLDGENKTIFLGNPFPLKKKKKAIPKKSIFKISPLFFFLTFELKQMKLQLPASLDNINTDLPFTNRLASSFACNHNSWLH